MLMYKSIMHPYFKYSMEFWLGFFAFLTLCLLKVIEELRGTQSHNKDIQYRDSFPTSNN